MKKLIILFLFTINLSYSFAQNDSSLINSNNEQEIKFSGYIETYYSYDINNPSNHQKSNFIYSHNRTNEFNLNLGFIKAAYSSKKVKANLALMAGTYSNANLAAEDGVLKNIYEANIAVKLSKNSETYVETGVFSSHIGFESAMSKDCWTITRSIFAENSPYYECGIRLNHTSKNEKWFVSGLLLNGWQHINRKDGNNALALGHQLTWKPSEKVMINSSSFVGSDTPDTNRMMRYFHNFYGQFQVFKNVGLQIGLDYGIQQKLKNSTSYSSWYAPVGILRIKASENINLSLRTEMYVDKDQVMVTTGTTNGFQIAGISLGFDYKISENAVWRIEGRELAVKDQLFNLGNKSFGKNYTFTTSFAVSF